jgi:hypothetical protein
MQRHTLTAVFLLAGAGALCIVAGNEFAAMHQPDRIVEGPGVTATTTLATYHQGIRGSSADAQVFTCESGKTGATVVLLGGTHPNEPAGFLAAVVLVENATVREGRLLVVPQACGSGFTATDPLEGSPEFFTLAGRSGPRRFRFGSRAANPVDQWPDPLVYLHYPSGQQLSGNETRNLNRSYPGRPDGSFSEQTSYAIMQLLEKERADVAFDLHEAAPEIPIINALVSHEKGRDIAGGAVLNLEFNGLQFALEMSPVQFHGLSHREWGDRLPVLPFLMETSNPIQGRLRGKTNEALIVLGVDERYRAAAALGTIRITYDSAGEPLDVRVGRHLEGFLSVVQVWNEAHPEKRVTIEGVPTYAEIVSRGVGAYLR